MSSSSPIGPPPPSTTDDDTSQLVDQALAQRQSQSRTGWNRLSLTHTPITPLTPYFRKKTEPEPSSSNNNERAENATGTTSTPDRAGRSSPARQDTIREEGNERSTKSPSKISKRGTMKRNMTSGSIKLEGLAEASPAGVSLKTPQKALYRYADVYENQRGYGSSTNFSGHLVGAYGHAQILFSCSEYILSLQGSSTVHQIRTNGEWIGRGGPAIQLVGRRTTAQCRLVLARFGMVDRYGWGRYDIL
ncbi:hypothetical protein FRC16_003430 [Serendipita sp. 398]|nr:hypothetical protein FRC16_003430 [Serendipita sp. 398]